MITTQIDVILFIRMVNIILALTCIVMWIMFYKKEKNIGAFAPVSWLFNFLAFSIWRFLNPDNSIDTLITASWWTALLCTHVIILLLVSALMSSPSLKQIADEKEIQQNNMRKQIDKYLKEEREK